MELNKEISFLGNYLATQHEPYFASFNKLRRHLLHETYSTLGGSDLALGILK